MNRGKVRALSQILAHSIVGLARPQEREKKRGFRKEVRITEIRAITRDDNNYALLFMVTRHATQILLSAAVSFPLRLLLSYFFLPSSRERREQRVL